MIEPRNIPYVNNLIPGLLDALPEPLYVWPSVSGIMARVYANRAEFDRFGGAFVSSALTAPVSGTSARISSSPTICPCRSLTAVVRGSL
jgi:hypothetical protein